MIKQAKRKAIAVLGGMGPEASVFMYKRMIELSTQLYGVNQNDEFPEIILHSIPVPDFISTTTEKQRALEMLQERVVLLNKLDISCIAMACNTAHILFDQLQEISRVPFISMIDTVVDAVRADGIKQVGLIGTPITTKENLYQDVLDKYGIETIIPRPEQIDMQASVIRNVIAGKLLKNDSMKLQGIAQSLAKKGAEGIILGCTEIPLVFPEKYSLPVYDSVDILSKELLKNYYQ